MGVKLLKSVIICGIGVLSSNLLASAEEGKWREIEFACEIDRILTQRTLQDWTQERVQRLLVVMAENPEIKEEVIRIWMQCLRDNLENVDEDTVKAWILWLERAVLLAKARQEIDAKLELDQKAKDLFKKRAILLEEAWKKIDAELGLDQKIKDLFERRAILWVEAKREIDAELVSNLEAEDLFEKRAILLEKARKKIDAELGWDQKAQDLFEKQAILSEEAMEKIDAKLELDQEAKDLVEERTVLLAKAMREIDAKQGWDQKAKDLFEKTDKRLCEEFSKKPGRKCEMLRSIMDIFCERGDISENDRDLFVFASMQAIKYELKK